MSKKELLARTLCATRTLPLAASLWPKPAREIKILAYHRVLDVPNEDAFLFDLDLISASTEDFDWQVRHARDNYDPMTFAELIDCLDGKQKLPKKPLIFTFDDGFDDNCEFAFPSLKRHGVPATIFISTDYIGGDRTYWFDWVVYLINHLGGRTVEIAGLEQSYRVPDDLAERREFAQDFLERLKRVPDATRRAVVDELQQIADIDFPSGGFRESRPMSWEQVREMQAGGIEFGSHTSSHPILKQVPDEGLARELGESKQVIEAQLGVACDVIAYPVGGAHAYDERIIKHVEQSGYRLAASYQSGINPVDSLETFALKRLHVEREVSRELFAASLAIPGLFG
jgi:peptidoglycan/xylan/chitin deacetylase (PgdA/CDA1 family)